MTFKKIIGQIHLWLGLASGLVVFILGVTGCIWAFEEEIKSIVYKDKLYVASKGLDPKPLSESVNAAKKALGYDMPIHRIYIPNNQERSHIIRNYTPNKESEGIWYWNDVKHNLWIYVDPYTTEVLNVENNTFEFFRVVLALHWSLLLKNEIGQPIVGTATLIFVVMLITGLILWWPKSKKAFKVNAWFRWKSTTKWRRKNYDLHNIVGFYSMFLALFIALTGLMWAFDWFSDSVEWIANGGNSPEQGVRIESDIKNGVQEELIDIIYHSLQVNYPKAEWYYLFLPKDSVGTLNAFVSHHDKTENVRLQFDQYSGKQLAYTDWTDMSGGEKVWAYNYDIHTGAIGGIVGKTIAFFLSLFSASLPITGFYIWWGRRRKNKYPGAKKLEEGEEAVNNNSRLVLKRPVIKKAKDAIPALFKK